jgi:hypothetical protein
MVDIVKYGTVVPIPFRITLNGVPVDLTIDTDIVDADVSLFRDGAFVANIDISAQVAKISNGGHVFYEWTPTAGQLNASEYATLCIQDVSAGGEFDPNMIVLYTCGNASARYG